MLQTPQISCEAGERNVSSEHERKPGRSSLRVMRHFSKCHISLFAPTNEEIEVLFFLRYINDSSDEVKLMTYFPKTSFKSDENCMISLKN